MLEFEDTFWLYDDTVDAWLSQPFRGRRVRRGPPRRKGKGRGHQAENVSDLKAKVKAAKANTAPTGAKMRSKEKHMSMPIGPRRAKAIKVRKANHMPNHQRVEHHTVPIKGRGKHAHTAA